MKQTLIHVTALLLLTSACVLETGGGGPEPAAYCEDLTATLCEKLYACLTPEERQANGLPVTEGACVSQFRDALGCDGLTEENACPGSSVFQPDEAESCIEQWSALECAQVRGRETEEFTPACQRDCAVE
jgi:hypothetical protein